MTVLRAVPFPIPYLRHGWIADQPKNEIEPNMAVALENIRLRRGYMEKREGLISHGLTGSPYRIMFMALLQYETGILELLIFDRYLARQFNGDVYRQVMPTTVLAGGNNFQVLSSNKKRVEGQTPADINSLAAGDFFSLDADPVSGTVGDSWTRVESVTAGSHATLEEDYRGTTFDTYGPAKYVDTTDQFQGTNSDYFDGAMVLNKFVVCNGVGSVWTKVESADLVKLEDLGGGSGTPVTSKYVTSFGARLYLMNQPGDSANNQYQFSAPGEINKLAVVDGGGKLQIRDDEFAILGTSNLRGVLVAYKKSTIHLGRPTPDPTNPVDFSQILSQGVGLLAPQSLVSTRNFDAFLGPDDFYRFDGGTPTPIGDKRIREHLFSTLNYDNLGQIYGFADDVKQEITWIVPEGAESEPVAQYVYNWNTGAWMHDTLPNDRTAMTRFFAGNQMTLAQLAAAFPPGALSDIPGTLGTYSGANDRPFMLVGHSDGTVSEISPGTANDNGVAFTASFTTKEFDYRGQQILVRGQPVEIRPDDILTVDHIDVTYRSDLPDTSITLQVSTDGGGNWNTLGTLDLPNGSGGDDTLPFYGPAISGRKFIYRALNSSSTQQVAIRDITPYVTVSGKV